MVGVGHDSGSQTSPMKASDFSAMFGQGQMTESFVLNDALLEKIRDLHTGPERGYHAWSHPLALLKLFEQVRDRLHDPLAVYCAIVLHDAIYEPRRPDNEARSTE